MKLTVVTPSFKQHDWLRLCAASVADQQGVDFEHIIQDGGCTPEAQAALEGWPRQWPRLRVFVERDAGMYDAVNRGLRRATGDICSYLNCDEQYLPGALAKVADYFERHPHVAVLFADTIVVDAQGGYICDRKALTPQKAHTMVSGNLSFLTCSLFFRRHLLEHDGLYFSEKFRDVGDADWTLRALERRCSMGTLGSAASIFAETGNNMNYKPNAQREAREMMAAAPWWARAFRPLVVAHFRFRRLLAGGYAQAPYQYSIYTQASPSQRVTVSVPRPTHRWVRPGLAANATPQ